MLGNTPGTLPKTESATINSITLIWPFQSMTPLISRKTLNEFREFLAGYFNLDQIRMEFEAADVPRQKDYIPNVGDDRRRMLIEQFYKGVDLTSIAEVRKLVTVFENILSGLEHQIGSGYSREWAKHNFDNLCRWLRKDEFTFSNGRLTSNRLKEATLSEVPPGFEFRNPEPFLTTIARLCAQEGKAREVAVLAHGVANIQQTDIEQFSYNEFKSYFTLYIQVPHTLYGQLGDKREEVEKSILEKCHALMGQYPDDRMERVQISPALKTDPQWREKAQVWLAGKNITNQGRVRSDNIASRVCDGLLFRSQPEIYLYQALKALSVSFAPLPVFVRGGESYRRIEPDFVIIKDGIMMVVEVDGDTVHEETPAEAHDRTTMLLHEGVFFERLRASECDDLSKARVCASRLVQVLEKRRAAR